MTLSRKFDPTTGYSNKKLRNKFTKWELDDVTKHPKECIAELKLLRREIRKLDVQINDSEIIIHIL